MIWKSIFALQFVMIVLLVSSLAIIAIHTIHSAKAAAGELEMIVFSLAALVTISMCHGSRLENKTGVTTYSAINITKKSIMINVYLKFLYFGRKFTLTFWRMPLLQLFSFLLLKGLLCGWLYSTGGRRGLPVDHDGHPKTDL